MRPQRIQLRRFSGWRMPENTVIVSRPSKWGNRHRIGGILGHTASTAVEAYRHELENGFWISVDEVRRGLRGKNLACWCPAGAPCHADVLLEVANS